MFSNQLTNKNYKILVSLINWRNYADTISCLPQLKRMCGLLVEILIIDNHSQNGSVSIIKAAFPEIKIIESPVNNGFAAGHKIAVDYAMENHFELLWILNPDVILMENTLTALIAAYSEKGNAIYGSISVKEDEPDIIEFAGAYEIISPNRHETLSPSPTCRGRVRDGVNETKCLTPKLSSKYHIHKGESLSVLQQTSATIKVGAVEGFSMLVPLELIKMHGFMDTSFFMYGEETEYCLRLHEKGVPSYIVTSSVIVHQGEGSFQKADGKNKVIAYYRSRNFRLIAKKYFGLTNAIILNSVGGFMALTVFFIKWKVAGKNFRKGNLIDYFHNLGILHALFGIKGKKISPENYL